MRTRGITLSKVSPSESVLASSVLGPDESGTTDRRDVVGSNVLVCQTCITCDLLGGVSTGSRTTVLEEMPFFLRFRVARPRSLARFDMVVRSGDALHYVNCSVGLIHSKTHGWGEGRILCPASWP